MPESKILFDQLGMLATESRNPRTMKIDAMSTREILAAINREDRTVPAVVAKEIPHIARAVELVVGALKNGGRLVYIGAGTSGRLGVLDAAECPPTYGVEPETVQGIIAGGSVAVFRSQEGVEDFEEEGARAMHANAIKTNDVVCGIAASMRTPYVIGAIKEAKRLGASTCYVTANSRRLFRSPQFRELKKALDVAICLEVGPEVIMGSTRMKAGTAQKLVLNMITTAAMIRLGKVYENMMIDLKLNSQKLEERAKRVIMIATGAGYDEAAKNLSDAGGSVKTAIVMMRAGVTREEAAQRLERSGGFARPAIDNKKRKK